MIGDSAVLQGQAPADYFKDASIYREIQYFPGWVYALSAAPGLLLLFGALGQLGLGRPFGGRPMSDAGLAVLTLALVGLPVFLYGLLLRMETIVDPGGLTVRFGTFGWIHRSVAMADLVSASSVAFRPIRDFGGWGIRYGKGLWCYNTRGNRGVLVATKAGKKFIVGSQSPEILASAIQNILPPQRRQDAEETKL